MISNGKKTLFSIIVIVLIIISVSYVTYAYFQSFVKKDILGGNSYNTSYDVNATVIYKANSLIPVDNSIINKAISKSSNKCIDDSNRDVCSLYELSVVNNGVELSLTGFVKTTSSTYITDNLKYRVYTKSNDVYTEVTDILTVSNNSDDIVYFKNNNINYSTLLTTNNTITYYIVFWIEEIDGIQNDDQNKSYSCKFGFEGVNGSKLSGKFNV